MFPTPGQLGLPKKYKDWRVNQPIAIQDALDAVRRFIVQKQRQGQGKSVTSIGLGLIDKDRRYGFLTSTKGLQDQMLDDFGSCGLVDIRGKSSYECDGVHGHTCAEGSVAKCIYKGSSLCSYSAAKQEASTSRLVMTNYPCWIALHKYAQGLGKFDVLICDEAHNIPSELEKAMSITLGHHEICEDLGRDWVPYNDRFNMSKWKHWAQVTKVIVDRELERLKIDLDKAGKTACGRLAKGYNHSLNLSRRLGDIGRCRAEEWVSDEWTHGYKFDPIKPAEHAESLLWRGIPKIILVSGTITPSTLEQSGIDIEDAKFFEYDSDVNPNRSPIMYIPTTKVNHWSQPWQLRLMVKRIDEIFESRLDRKGIVHTSSGKLRDFIMANSKYSRFFETNYSQNGDLTSAVIERFKTMKPPALLVSPSVTTGYDFPYDTCRYQIVAKLNYPYAASKIEQARLRLDPDRGSHHAILQLQQSVGRGDRADDDYQEVFIIDDAFPHLTWRYAEMFNPSFLACVRKLDKVPAPFMLEAC